MIPLVHHEVHLFIFIIRNFSGEPISVLDGVPIAIKDEIDCMPYPTTGEVSFH